MQLSLLSIIATLALASAEMQLSLCGEESYEWLDQTVTFRGKMSTPPSTTEYTVYFNPCSPVDAEQCEPDDHLCVVETVKDKDSGSEVLYAVMPFGSQRNGAKLGSLVSYGIEAIASYDGSKWGGVSLSGRAVIECAEHPETRADLNGTDLVLHMKRPELCQGKMPKPGKKHRNSGWGFFTWLFVLIILAGIGYAALTVYINFAQSRGNLPLAADIGDVLRDLPYLLRDILRKLNFMNRGSSSSGYSAL